MRPSGCRSHWDGAGVSTCIDRRCNAVTSHVGLH